MCLTMFILTVISAGGVCCQGGHLNYKGAAGNPALSIPALSVFDGGDSYTTGAV